MDTKELKNMSLAVVASLLLGACAESTPVAPPQAAQSTPVVPTKTCQSDYSTGSHYNRTVECVSDEDRDLMEEQTRQQMQNYRALQSGTSAH